MNKWVYTLFYACILIISCACAETNSSLQDSTPTQELRVSNIGDEDIYDLKVVFPGDTPVEAEKTSYGDIESGETTGYLIIPNGVYQYAAYEYTFNDQVIYQSVVDWLGEEPMSGTLFTYQIEFDSERVQGDQIHLINVLNEND